MNNEKPTAPREDRGNTTQANVDVDSPAAAAPEEHPSLETASPYGMEEVRQFQDAALQGTQAPPAHQVPNRGTLDKAPEPDQPLNPRRQKHSRRGDGE